MKKKKLLIIVVIFIILVFLVIVGILKRMEYNRGIVNKLIYNSWSLYRQEYFRTKNTNFEIPTASTLILFGEKSVEFCVPYEPKEDEVLDEDVVSKSICTKYDYSVTAKEITLIIDGKEMIYDYKFNEEEQLVLTILGDGHEYNIYYNKNGG